MSLHNSTVMRTNGLFLIMVDLLNGSSDLIKLKRAQGECLGIRSR